jgi:hypothetical protein
VIDRACLQRFELGERVVGVRDQEAMSFSITDDGDWLLPGFGVAAEE